MFGTIASASFAMLISIPQHRRRAQVFMVLKECTLVPEGSDEEEVRRRVIQLLLNEVPRLTVTLVRSLRVSLSVTSSASRRRVASSIPRNVCSTTNSPEHSSDRASHSLRQPVGALIVAVQAF